MDDLPERVYSGTWAMGRLQVPCQLHFPVPAWAGGKSGSSYRIYVPYLLWKMVQGPVIVLGFLFVIAELFMIHNSYQFWKKLPSEDFQMYFSQFFSARQAHLGGLVDEEEDL